MLNASELGLAGREACVGRVLVLDDGGGGLVAGAAVVEDGWESTVKEGSRGAEASSSSSPSVRDAKEGKRRSALMSLREADVWQEGRDGQRVSSLTSSGPYRSRLSVVGQQVSQIASTTAVTAIGRSCVTLVLVCHRV